jgi:hypothetical protein
VSAYLYKSARCGSGASARRLLGLALRLLRARADGRSTVCSSFAEEYQKQWETIAPILPRHYVTERRILYNRREIDEWLMVRTSPLDV